MPIYPIINLKRVALILSALTLALVAGAVRMRQLHGHIHSGQ